MQGIQKCAILYIVFYLLAEIIKKEWFYLKNHSIISKNVINSFKGVQQYWCPTLRHMIDILGR